MTVILMVLIMVKTLDMMIIMLLWPFDFNPLYIESLHAARVSVIVAACPCIVAACNRSPCFGCRRRRISQ